ncbi:MAG TPA: hypothetical protein VI452_17060 [Marmoricola sp.]|jgi:type II secretory pathway component PulJ
MRPTWPIQIADRLFSQEPARRNAHRASAQLADRRAAIEDTERFLRAHLDRHGPWHQRTIPEQRAGD